MQWKESFGANCSIYSIPDWTNLLQRSTPTGIMAQKIETVKPCDYSSLTLKRSTSAHTPGFTVVALSNRLIETTRISTGTKYAIKKYPCPYAFEEPVC